LGSVPTTGQQAAAIGNGVTILTASKSDETAAEIGGHGVFTGLLVEALKGGAADITGFITPGGIYAYIDKALGPWQQRPVFKTNVTQFTPLRTIKSQIEISILRKIAEYFVEPDEEYMLDPSCEYTNDPKEKHDYRTICKPRQCCNL
jgi:hypothetical protein